MHVLFYSHDRARCYALLVVVAWLLNVGNSSAAYQVTSIGKMFVFNHKKVDVKHFVVGQKS